MISYELIPADNLPMEADWLSRQPYPVIAWGKPGTAQEQYKNADVLVETQEQAEAIAQRVKAKPRAAQVLVQVLRAVEHLPTSAALDMESLAYSTLQGGPEFSTWLSNRGSAAQIPAGQGPAVLLEREGDCLRVVLNRPELRNAISVEIRDGLVEALELLALDTDLTQMTLSGRGACFSSGGELAEFGGFSSIAEAHWLRTVHSPARLMAEQGHKITCYVHGACIGSGIELPAFCQRVIAHPKTFFQLPELNLGLIPGAGGTLSISRRIGRQRTAWLVLSGRRINAQTALNWGLVDGIEDFSF